ncbi:hypothetical protein EDD21DRAFT_429059 [Dissophora ornata]|nr:hypothetical protein EDD21DRAFT_429059 [Dissophora ornata]
MSTVASSWASLFSSSSSTLATPTLPFNASSSPIHPCSTRFPAAKSHQRRPRNFFGHALGNYSVPSLNTSSFARDTTISDSSFSLNSSVLPNAPQTGGPAQGIFTHRVSSAPDLGVLGELCHPVIAMDQSMSQKTEAPPRSPTSNDTRPSRRKCGDCGWSPRGSMTTLKKIGASIVHATKSPGSLLQFRIVKKPIAETFVSPLNINTKRVDPTLDHPPTASSGITTYPLDTSNPPSLMSYGTNADSMKQETSMAPGTVHVPQYSSNADFVVARVIPVKAPTGLKTFAHGESSKSRVSSVSKGGCDISKQIQHYPNYDHLLMAIEGLSGTVEDLSRKITLMMDLKDIRTSCSVRKRTRQKGCRKLLPPPPSNAPPIAPKRAPMVTSSIPRIPSLPCFEPLPQFDFSSTMDATFVSRSLLVTPHSMADCAIPDLGETRLSSKFILKIQQSLQSCQEPPTCLMSPMVSQALASPVLRQVAESPSFMDPLSGGASHTPGYKFKEQKVESYTTHTARFHRSLRSSSILGPWDPRLITKMSASRSVSVSIESQGT